MHILYLGNIVAYNESLYKIETTVLSNRKQFTKYSKLSEVNWHQFQFLLDFSFYVEVDGVLFYKCCNTLCIFKTHIHIFGLQEFSYSSSHLFNKDQCTFNQKICHGNYYLYYWNHFSLKSISIIDLLWTFKI